MFLEISIETFNSRVNIILKLHAETTKLDFKKSIEGSSTVSWSKEMLHSPLALENIMINIILKITYFIYLVISPALM